MAQLLHVRLRAALLAVAASLALSGPALAQTYPNLPVANPPAPTDLMAVWQGAALKQTTVGAITGVVVPACNGVTDMTAAIDAAIVTANANNTDVILPSGNCIISAGLTPITGSGVHVRGQGPTATTLTPSGTFNLFTFNGSGTAQDGSVENLTISAAGLTGYDIYINAYNRMLVRNVIGQNTYNFLYHQSANVLALEYINVFNVRGAYCFNIVAPGSARTDVVEPINVTCGGATGSTYKGLVLNGFVNTIDVHHMAFSAPVGEGLLMENTVSGTQAPEFFTAHDFQVEQASGVAGMDLEAGSDIYCTSCYSSSNVNDGVYISTSTDNVNLISPLIELNGTYGIEDYANTGGTGAFGMIVTGGCVCGNSHASFGAVPEIIVGSATNNTVINGVDLDASTASYGVTVQSGAQGVILANNNYTGAITGEVHDLSGNAAIIGGIAKGGGALGPNLTLGGTSGAKVLGLSNPGVTGGTYAQINVSTGTANAYAIFENQDGSSPTGIISTGPGDTGGLAISTASGGVVVTAAPAAGVSQFVAANTGVTSGTQSQIIARTGTANAYVLLDNTDGSTPAAILGSGLADTGGLALQTLAGNVFLQPASGGVVSASAPVVTSGYMRPGLTLYANLGTADPSPQVGDKFTISDASACTVNTQVSAGGGTTHSCAVVYNGVGWFALVTH